MKRQVNKICEICSDKGIGRHFGAITCESCKAFFRRNANKEQELIQSNEEREQRRRVVEENRRKRLVNESQTSSSDANESSNPPSIVSTISDDSFLCDITGSVLDVTDEDLSAQIMEIENYVNNEDTDQSIETLGERLMLKEIRQRAQKIVVIPMFKELTDYNGLNDLEVNKIGELLAISKIFDYPDTKNTLIIQNKLDYVHVYSKRSEESVKEALNYCKGLSGFTNTCPDDQYTLFKHGSVEMMLLRSLMFYNDDEKYFKLNLELPNHIKQFKYFFEEYLDKFLPQWKRDRLILELISAIALFNPNRPNLKHRHNIRLEQQFVDRIVNLRKGYVN
ncbi:unnamed protein product [Oppiella nova]|uniref:Uncharacterized protein n=1 Tax=Oppiella nova TaxID=334625 RepID=A0A7R9Q9U6_9ACAR|nr:unnamed protein product [Oppiella nova]CAG2161445.1 unnamed protein product [Oppiella nova]